MLTLSGQKAVFLVSSSFKIVYANTNKGNSISKFFNGKNGFKYNKVRHLVI